MAEHGDPQDCDECAPEQGGVVGAPVSSVDGDGSPATIEELPLQGLPPMTADLFVEAAVIAADRIAQLAGTTEATAELFRRGLAQAKALR